MATEQSFVRVADADDLREDSPQIVHADGHSIGLFFHEGEVHAVDNRCPHMGFPLTKGSVDDGILTCHWHHARFELSCGDTFDPFADDVRTYPVEVRDGDVYVQPNPPRDEPPEEHWRNRLGHGLRENISLVVAKSVIGLESEEVPSTVPVELGTEFGTHYRQAGWGRGLTTLGVMTNLLPALRPEDRRRALYVGLTEVADNCSGEPPFFVQEALSTDDVSAERLTEWFRDNIEVRDSDGAERVLRAGITADLDESDVAGMLVAAATDHLYLDTGHRLDFINKAFETLDHIGWERADDVLPSLVPGLASANRAEENSSWRQPIDVAQLCFDAAEELPDLLEAGEGKTWEEPDDFVDVLLGEDPHAIVDAVTDAIENGATATELARVVTFAAARRVAHFGTSNEFGDWNTVHHSYTYANAVDGLSRRTDAPEVYRGVFDAAMNVYLDRFLNTPPTPIPDPDGDRDPDAALDELMETFEVEADEEVDLAGESTAAYLAAGGDADRLKRKLGEALVREDVGFHTRQNVEVAFGQYDALAGEGTEESERRARIHLIATARYLSAHTPTRRAGEQTFRIAERLHQGENIHEMD
ncbi:ferredoxin [Haladaptatus sp. W1]|uniref:Rieske (2Fe-2S) protein n=1 Tax=Haladaptatus sp. W1 TaxID=1897478 RepID=UPI000849E738|nr:Rieske 2Fe-2S domain-containing protein [Haladaptatus sp. W1]ODR79289.1 ferredoxin [Haladaptatus sp. W1]